MSEAEEVTRRDFVKSLIALTASASVAVSCGQEAHAAPPPAAVAHYPIDGDVKTTLERTIRFPAISGLAPRELPRISDYGRHGYGIWSFGPGLACEKRGDLMPLGWTCPPDQVERRLLRFFAMTDIHITDKEAPNQLIGLQQSDDPMAQACTSIYSPVMPYTTHVLDAAIQTVNALHRKAPFDFGISLGDASNSTACNELRWYLDVIDGHVVHPSSGAHLGERTVDFQKPFKAVGLDKTIPWYQVIGNHDKFFLGSFDVYHFPNPAFDMVAPYTGDTVWAVGDVFSPKGGALNLQRPTARMGVIDGSSPQGAIVGAGPLQDFQAPPRVAPDPNRRPLTSSQWVGEFSRSTTSPLGHGFGLVAPAHSVGFACYSFVPKAGVPLKIIVLDDNQGTGDGSYDIHGHGFLDEERWTWLKSELAAGDAAGQLMIVAAHIPIGVAPLGSEVEWWRPDRDPYIGAPIPGKGTPTVQNAVTLQGLVDELQRHPNFLMWMAGHRHVNTVKSFPGPTPQRGFWQVETSSLRDYPQVFRTFDITLHADDVVSVVVTNVDPSVRAGTPAATSRAYAVAAQQICRTEAIYQRSCPLIDLATQAPVKGPDGKPVSDPSIRPMPQGIYNAQLFKKLTPEMGKKLRLARGN